MIANKHKDTDAPEKKALRVKTLRRYDLLPQKRLSSPEEINAYVEALRRELVKALNECDVIQMN